MTNLYYIENMGCDDTTCGLSYMTDDQFSVFKTVVENLNKNSTYGCMPNILVYKIDESFIRAATEDDPDYKILYMNNGKYALKDYIYIWSNADCGFIYKEGVERVI